MLFARSNRYNIVSPFVGIVLDFAREFIASSFRNKVTN